MNWKIKANVANLVGKLPGGLSTKAWVFLQRFLGRTVDCRSKLVTGVSLWEKLEKIGIDPRNKVFLELGTGQIPLVPLSFYLMGGGKVFSVDVNELMDSRKFLRCVKYVIENRKDVEATLGGKLDNERFNLLVEGYQSGGVSEILQLLNISYEVCPSGANLSLPDNSIDVYFSNTTLEHIPENELEDVLKESMRVLKKNGICLHYIDYHDHFATCDKKISAINFLRYSDAEWKSVVNNGILYTNRLRHSDMVHLIKYVGGELIFVQKKNSDDVKHELKEGFVLDSKFRGKTVEDLQIIGAWVAYAIEVG